MNGLKKFAAALFYEEVKKYKGKKMLNGSFYLEDTVLDEFDKIKKLYKE